MESHERTHATAARLRGEGGLSTEARDAQVINAGEQLLCRAQAVGRRMEEHMGALRKAHGFPGPADRAGGASAAPGVT